MGRVKSLKGRLLVANPAMPDPNFHRTVVLLLAHQEDGALGVVLNRPSELDVDSPLPRWERLVADPPVVFVGGPDSALKSVVQGALDTARAGAQRVVERASAASIANGPEAAAAGAS